MKTIFLTFFAISASCFAAVSPLYFYDGDTKSTLNLSAYPLVYMYGGHINGIQGDNPDSECYIYGGWVYTMGIGEGYMEINGGEIISSIDYSNNARLKITGGAFESIELNTREWWKLNHIQIECLNYSFSNVEYIQMGDAVGLYGSKLELTFADGTSDALKIQYTNGVAGATNPAEFFDFTIVPEPATLAFLGVAAIMAHKRRRKF